MKFRKVTVLMMAAALTVSSAGAVQAAEEMSVDDPAAEAEEEASSDTSLYTPATIAAADSLDPAEMFSDKDLDETWEDTAVRITLKGDTAEVDSDSVQVDGSTVTVTGEGVYVLSGTLSDGQIVVDAGEEDKVKLVLDSVTVTNDDSACLFVKAADKVILTMAEGSENSFSDTGAEYVQPDEGSTVDSVIFSREDLSVNGTGLLTVKAGYKHGIVCKDDLVLAGCRVMVEAAEKGVVGEDSVRIKDAEATVSAGDDAIHSDTNDKEGKGFIYMESGSLTLEAGDDGIHAATALLITGGEIDVTGCYEGLEGAAIDILDGDIRVKAQDDAINAAYSSTDSDAEIEWDNGGMMPMQDGFGQRPEKRNESVPDEDMWDEAEYEEAWEVYLQGQETETGTDSQDPYSDVYEAESDGEEIYANGSGDEAYDDSETFTDIYDAVEDWEVYTDIYDTDAEDLEAYTDIYDTDAEDRETYTDIYDTDAEDWDVYREDSVPGGGPGQDFGHGPGGNMQGGFGGMDMMEAQEDSYLRIAGGTIYVNAGGDGLDSNGYIYLEGGTVQVDGPENDGNGSMDYAIDAVVTGGTLLASGSAGMAVGFGGESTQSSLYYTFDNNIPAGTEVVIVDEEGNEVYTGTPEKSFRNVIFTAEELEEGRTYTITAGNVSGTAEAGTGQGFGMAAPGADMGGGMPGGKAGTPRF